MVALAGAMNAQALVAEFQAAHGHDAKKDADALAKAAAAWLTSLYLASMMRALRAPIVGILTDGYLIGSASAQALERGGALSVELTEWRPGDEDAAALLLGRWGDGAGLAGLLATAEVTIKSIAQTRLAELGRILGQGVADGTGVDVLAAEIRSLLAVPSRAQMIAQTEISRAVNAAAATRYKAAGYLASSWLTEAGNVCAVCLDNADQGPVALGEPFRSGDTQPPAHPRCRCVTVPERTEM